jgi:hypothetical protein
MRPYANLQAVFDVAYVGMAKQGFIQSANGNFDCMYRGPHGLKCAIGHCVPDEYMPMHENNADVISMINKDPNWDELFQNVDIDALQSLQDAHDNAAGKAEMVKANMLAFATKFNLTVPEVA